MNTGPRIEPQTLSIIDRRMAVVRSDRREILGVRSELRFPFGSFAVCNYSATGIAILIDEGAERFSRSEEYTASLSIEGIDVGSHTLSVVRRELRPPGEGLRIAFEIQSGLLPVDKIQTVVQLRKVLADLQKTREEMGRIPSEFRRMTLEAKLFLQELEGRLDRMSAEKKHCSLDELRDFQETMVTIVANVMMQQFAPVFPQLEACLVEVPEGDRPTCMAFFREQLKELIYQSPFSHRSVTKPLGYAGDFEMMNIIYRNEHAGGSLFAKCLNAYWLDYAEARAVRNRSLYLFQVLMRAIGEASGAPLKIGSIACGPSREVQMIVASAAERGLDLARCEFHLLDQDLNALKHAHERLRHIVKSTNSPVRLKFVNRSVRHLLSKTWEERDFDLLYSAGLFDYFSDPVARMVAKALHDRLKPGGQLIIGNFTSAAPNQFAMRLALDWNLIYRSAEDLQLLYRDLGGDMTVEQEPEGVNLFCVIRKPLAD